MERPGESIFNESLTSKPCVTPYHDLTRGFVALPLQRVRYIPLCTYTRGELWFGAKILDIKGMGHVTSLKFLVYERDTQ